MATMTMTDQNPFLREVRDQFTGVSTLATLVLQMQYVRSLLHAVGQDFNLRGEFEDTSCVDRQNSTYERLCEVLESYAMPGDLFDALEALDFLIRLIKENS